MLVDAYFIDAPTGEWHALANHIEQLARLQQIQLIVNGSFQIPFHEPVSNLTITVCKDFSSYLRLLAKAKGVDVFCINFWNVLIQKFLVFFRPARILYWVQGVSPEESFMRHKSYFRFYLLSFLEFFALKFANLHIFVSEYMKVFFEQKYRLKFEDFQVIPCTSSLRFLGLDKQKNLFVYVGGMSVWQRVDLALEFFHEFYKSDGTAVLKIITPDVKEAQAMLENFPNLKNAVQIISGLKRPEIEELLNKAQFGFLIRDDNSVNNVSSPVKLAEYLSCDVQIITNDCIKSYSEKIKKFKAGYLLNNENRLDEPLIYHPEQSLRLYEEVFSTERLFGKYQNLLRKRGN